MVDYYRRIERSVTISADKRSTVDLQVDVWSADANITKFILKLDTADSTAIDLTDATVTTALVYDGVILQDNGQVEEVATQRISYVLNERLRGYEGIVNGGFYVTLKTGQKIDIQNVSFNMRKSLIDTDLEPARENAYATFDTITNDVKGYANTQKGNIDNVLNDVKSTGNTAKTQIGQVLPDVQSEGEKVKTNINAVVSDVSGYADSQKQAIHNIVSDVQSTGDTAKEDIKATLPSIQAQVSELKSDLADVKANIEANSKANVTDIVFNSESITDFAGGSHIGNASIVPSSSTMCCHESLSLVKGDVIENTNSNYKFFLTDSNGEFISSQWDVTSYTTTIDYPTVYVNVKRVDNKSYTSSDIAIINTTFSIKSPSPYSKVVHVDVTTGNDDRNNGSKAKPFATIQKAIDSYAETIIVKPGVYRESITVSNRNKLSILSDIDGLDYSAPETPKVIISGGKSFVSSLSSGLYVYPYTVASTSKMYKVFISKTLINKDASYQYGLRDGYIVTLWNRSKPLASVLTLAECQSSADTWFYDGTNIYVNSTSDDGWFTLVDGESPYVGMFENIKSLNLENISFKYGGHDVCRIEGCNGVNICDCKFAFSNINSGLVLRNSNGCIRNCESMNNRNDGFGISAYGDSHFLNCIAHDNGDDGISHHQGATGSIQGGEYYNNLQGGVTSPTYGANVDVYNVYCHDNYNGIWAIEDESLQTYGKVIGCISQNNTQYDFYNQGAKTVIGNNKFGSKHTANNHHAVAVTTDFDE